MLTLESLEALAKKVLERGSFRTNDCHRRIRIVLDKEYIVDTLEAKYVWERDDPFYPQYSYSNLPRADLKVV